MVPSNDYNGFHVVNRSTFVIERRQIEYSCYTMKIRFSIIVETFLTVDTILRSS